MKNQMVMVILIGMGMGLFTGCGTSDRSIQYNDGSYTGKSSPDDRGATGEVSLAIADGKIISATFITVQKDGTIKDKNYGKTSGNQNLDYYQMAQLAVRAMPVYANQLVAVQNVADVDVIAGATIAYNQFVQAVEDALKRARK